MKIKILGDKERFLAPTKGTEKSAAYDLYVQEDVVIKGGRQIVPTGFAIELDPDTAAEIRPRSGYSSKGMEGHEVFYDGLCGSYDRFDADVLHGLVDEDYRNEIGIIINSNEYEDFLIKRGTRIAQMLIVNVPNTEIEYVDELSETNRHGGFGSTNK